METTLALSSCTGTTDKYNEIEIFGCCPVSDFVMFPVNLTEALKTKLMEIASIKRKEKMSYTFHNHRWFPQFILEKFQVKYNDGTVLNFTYRELYSTEFSSKDCWINMFLVLSSGYFCSFNKIGLLMTENTACGLYRKEYIKQSEIQFHSITNFGNAFGLSWLSYTNLVI